MIPHLSYREREREREGGREGGGGEIYEAM
jgi:hypothetical protein